MPPCGTVAGSSPKAARNWRGFRCNQPRRCVGVRVSHLGGFARRLSCGLQLEPVVSPRRCSNPGLTGQGRGPDTRLFRVSLNDGQARRQPCSPGVAAQGVATAARWSALPRATRARTQASDRSNAAVVGQIPTTVQQRRWRREGRGGKCTQIPRSAIRAAVWTLRAARPSEWRAGTGAGSRHVRQLPRELPGKRPAQGQGTQGSAVGIA